MSVVERQRCTQAGSREPTSLDRTDAIGERRLRGARRASNGSEPRNRGKLAKKPMMGHKKKYISKSSIRRNGEKPDCSKCPGVSSRHALRCREKLGCATESEMMQRVHKTAWTKRDADYLSFLTEAERRAVDPDQCLDMDDSGVHNFEKQRRCCLERSQNASEGQPDLIVSKGSSRDLSSDVSNLATAGC